jgi:hypothetical protein
MTNAPPISDAMQALANSQKQTKKPKGKDTANKSSKKEEENGAGKYLLFYINFDPILAAPLAPRNSASNTADSDSGRPRSSNDFSNGGATTATAFHEELASGQSDEEDGDDELEEHDEYESADDYPEQPKELYEAERTETGDKRPESSGTHRSQSPGSQNSSPRSQPPSPKSPTSLHVETRKKREATRDGTSQSGRPETASDKAETRDGRPDSVKTLEVERQLEEQEEMVDQGKIWEFFVVFEV